MIKLINRITGGEMWVHESRLDTYLAAGHMPAVQAVKAADPAPAAPPMTVKRARTTKKKG